MTEPEVTQLGRYELLRMIARGGMGEIYVARARGAVGFEKKVIIKRILPHLAEEQEFVDKFVDEAHIVTHLTHGNIVPVFDMGEEDGELYIAMEYIAGRDLRDVLKRAKAESFLLPVDVALFIAAETCKGLAYAHRRTDDAGRPLDLVHRDVSPSNILISKDGEVKIVDFGIAKASGKISKSITGRLQGKFCYMSPEQAAGKSVDHRSDIFSTGVVLYELLTNTRPFEGAQDLESLDLVRNHQPPPPSEVRAGVPADVDEIVMRALAKDPHDRYLQVDEFERALLTHLYTSGGLTSRQVAEQLAELFPEGIERPDVRAASGTPRRGVSLDDALSAEMERLLSGRTPSNHGVVDPHMDTATGGLSVGSGSETRSLLVDGQSAPVLSDSAIKIRIGTPAAGTDPEALGKSTTEEMPGLGAVGALGQTTPSHGYAYDMTPAGGLTPTGPLLIAPQPRSRASRYGTVAIAILVAILMAAVGLLVWDSYFASPVLMVQTLPAGAIVMVDGAAVGKGGQAIDSLEPGEHRISARAEGYQTSEEQFITLEPGRRSRVNVRLVPEKQAPRFHKVSFTTEPPGATVFVLNVRRGVTPLEDVEIPATGADVRLVLPGHKNIELILEPDKIEPTYGLVFAREDAPVPVADLDAGPVAEEDATADPADKLEKATVRMAFDSVPAGARIIVGGRSLGVTPRTVSVPEGSLSVRLEKEGYEAFRTRIHTRSQRRVSATLDKAEAVAVALEPRELVTVTFRVFAPTVNGGQVVPSTLRIAGQKKSVPQSGNVSVKLAPGQYVASADAPAYNLKIRRSVNVSADMGSAPIQLNLRPVGP